MIHKNSAGWRGTDFDKLDKANKKDFTKNTLEEESTQAYASRTDENKCTLEREVISFSRSSLSNSVRLRWKKRFQEKGVLSPKIANGEISNCDDFVKS